MSSNIPSKLNNSNFTTTGGTTKTTPNAKIAAPAGSTSAFTKSLQGNYVNSIFNTDKHRQMAVPTETAPAKSSNLFANIMTALTIATPLVTALLTGSKAAKTNGTKTDGNNGGNKTDGTTDTKSSTAGIDNAIKDFKSAKTESQKTIASATLQSQISTSNQSIETNKGTIEKNATDIQTNQSISQDELGTISDIGKELGTLNVTLGSLPAKIAAAETADTANGTNTADALKDQLADTKDAIKDAQDRLETSKAAQKAADDAVKTLTAQNGTLGTTNQQLQAKVQTAQNALQNAGGTNSQKDGTGASDSSISKDIDPGVTGNLAKTMDGMMNKALTANQSSGSTADAGPNKRDLIDANTENLANNIFFKKNV